VPVVVAGLAALAWFAPAVIALSSLRDRPLAALFAGIDGRITSRAAAWRWWGGIEYRDVVLAGRDGRPLVAVPRVVVDRGLAALLFNPSELGAVRLVGAEALLEVRRGGSTLEDVLAPWLAALAQAPAPAVSFELEVVDAAVELVDIERNDAWRVTDILAAGTVRPDATLAGWTVSGRARHSGGPVRDLAAAANRIASDGAPHSAGPAGAVPRLAGPDRLDRTTVAAGATATLAREGGWSVSSPDVEGDVAPRTLAVAATRLPLGVSSVAATRFDARHLLDGLADLRLDITLPPAAPAAPSGQRPPGVRPAGGVRVAGVVSGTELAVCRSDSLAEVVAIDRVEMPLDLSIDGDRVAVRSLRVSSRLFQAEATGRIRLPTSGAWEWAEAQIGEDFAVAAEIDLAAAAQSLSGGVAVRPDVRVTQGQLQLSAAARNDGHDRVLELRATSRDLAAVQSVVADGGGRQDRQLRWSEPFTAWLRGRRGAGRGERLRVEEARVASSAAEVSAAGNADAAVVQWTVDLEKLVGEAAEVLELDGLEVAGVARGRLDLDRTTAGGAAHARLSASLTEFALARPGRPAWRDAELSIEAEGAGSLSAAAMLVDRGRAVVSAADDALEVTLTGGTLVNLAPLFGGSARGDGAWLRAVPGGQSIAADVTVAGDLGRWQARWAGVSGAGGSPSLAGSLKASAALAADGDGWRITRAGAEVEKLKVQLDGRQISEPRAMASAAGRWQPATGLVEISSAELLTATASLRTGGLAILPWRPVRGAVDAIVERVRGKVQWQADVGRLESWVAPPAAAARWPATGRAWGTAEILDTPVGLNLLVDATGSQLTLAGPPAGAAADARPVPLWSEPRASLVLEVTRPLGGAEPPGAEITVNQFKLESSTLALAAAGSVRDWSTRRLVDIGGNVAYDWEQVTRLVTPWTGGRVRLAGNGARPFVLRGPLGGLAAAAGAVAERSLEPSADHAQRLQLPAEWLAAAGGTPGTLARLAVPTPATRVRDGFAARLAAMSIETSAAWTGAEVGGFAVEPGEMPVRLFEGQLALGPFDLGAAGGRLRGSPWLRLVPPPGELVVPPGRCIDRVMLSRELSDRWVRWLVPLFGHAARMQGWMSVDLAGARVPLADPFAGAASGQVIFENLEAVPGGDVQPLVNLLAKLQTAIDPRFAFGDKVVLLRVRPDPVRVQLSDRRLWHDGLVIDSGQLVIRSAGSVAADGSLAVNVEVSFRGDIAGATPVVGKLLRTPLVIPLRGTVNRPQFDARALDMMVARIVENTADAVFNDGLGRSLEALFGNPQPPTPAAAPVPAPAPAPAPLSFPAPGK